MKSVQVFFNNELLNFKYNRSSGYYERELTAPEIGGVHIASISAIDDNDMLLTKAQEVQVLIKEVLAVDINKDFLWVFDFRDFTIKDIIEISDYELNIDEETNETSKFTFLRKGNVSARDIVAVKKNNIIVYWGIVSEVQNDSGKERYTVILKYITNMFNQNVELKNENVIREIGIEEFIKRTIVDNFIQNSDSFVNLDYLRVVVKTNTIKNCSVSNVQNRIYNLHTWLTNCSQLYNVSYDFKIEEGNLVMTIETNSIERVLIDVKAHSISDYKEVFETNIVSKVVVLTDTNPYYLYLLDDRTTTTDGTNPNRALGRTETIYTENYEEAPQKALDTIKGNSYNHNITFKYNKFLKLGTPISIKTEKSLIYDTYISSVKILPKSMYEYQCGNIRIKFIEKLLKERRQNNA